MLKYKQLTEFGSGGLVTDYQIDELLTIKASEFKQAIYDARYLLFRNIGKLTLKQAFDLNAKFGKVWTSSEYNYILEESTEETPGGPALGLYNSNKLERLSSGIMPYHADVPITFEDGRTDLTLPIRSLYAENITASAGYINLIDSMPLIKQVTAKEKKLWGKVDLRYQSWYKPGTNFHWKKMLQVHPVTGKEFLNLSTFSSTPWRDYGFAHYETWIVEMQVNNKHTYDLGLVSDLIKRLDIPQNRSTIYYEPYDFLILDNTGLLHSRSAVRSKPNEARSFWRGNIKHDLDFKYDPNLQS